MLDQWSEDDELLLRSYDHNGAFKGALYGLLFSAVLWGVIGLIVWAVIAL